jgi:hypothetical protein
VTKLGLAALTSGDRFQLFSAPVYTGSENIFQIALGRVMQQANPKHYQVFDCCVRQSMRASAVASMLGLTSAQVYLAKHRISAAVKRAARQVEVELRGKKSANALT